MARARSPWVARLAVLTVLSLLDVGPARAQPLADALPLHLLRTGDLGVLLTVDAQVAGRNGRWLIDTGSSQTLVSPRFADALGLAAGESRSLASVAGVLQGAVVALPAVQAGRFTRERLTAVRVDVSPILGPLAPGIDGVLGTTFFTGAVLEVDMAAATWRLRVGNAADAGPAAPGEPLEVVRGVPVVGLTLDGRAGRYVLDTGSAGGVVRITAGRAPLRLGRALQAQLGGQLRAQVPVAQLGAASLGRALPAATNGFAGMALLDGCRFTIDFAAGRFAVHECLRPALPGGYGLDLAEDAGGLVIARVYDASPAAAAGLRAGDRVTQLGVGALPGSLPDAWVQMAAPDNLRIGIKRGNAALGQTLQRAYFLPPLDD